MSKRLLIVDDDASIRNVLKESLEEEGYEVDACRDGFAALDSLRENPADLVISDLMMPEMTGSELLKKLKEESIDCGFIMVTAYGTIETAVEALQLGAFDFVTKPFSIKQITSRIARFFDFTGLQEENRQLRKQLSKSSSTKNLVGSSPAMSMIFNQIDIVAQSDVPVFIEGESGTGKELIAQAIHDASPRSEQPFLKINCSAIPDTLIESTLFGHEKGAYTHASKMTKGYFEEADGGTFLLDEITEMPLSMQAKLLRVLQEGVITRVGSSKEIRVNVRIIATSNRNLAQAIRDNQFRQDLYYRLNVFPVKVPPLRSRSEDVPGLIHHFLEKNRQKYGYEEKELDKESLELLMRHSWPGNIRELENVIERAVLYAGSEKILRPEHLSFGQEEEDSQLGDYNGALMSIAEMEKILIYNTLKKTNNNRTQAADILQISVRTLRNKLHEYEGTAADEDDA